MIKQCLKGFYHHFVFITLQLFSTSQLFLLSSSPSINLIPKHFEEENLTVAWPKLIRNYLIFAKDISFKFVNDSSFEEHGCQFFLNNVFTHSHNNLLLSIPLSLFNPLMDFQLIFESYFQQFLNTWSIDLICYNLIQQTQAMFYKHYFLPLLKCLDEQSTSIVTQSIIIFYQAFTFINFTFPSIYCIDHFIKLSLISGTLPFSRFLIYDFHNNS